MEKLKKTQQLLGEYIDLAELKEDYDMILEYMSGDLSTDQQVNVEVGGATVPLNAKIIKALTEKAGEKTDEEYKAKKSELKKSLSSIKFKK